ncbi:MAG: zinc-binding alcohol dehydrogenase [Chloroflexi bacterium]|nr:zinc-binding alcohol dehydrogenase [Chloroflexota bacterium]
MPREIVTTGGKSFRYREYELSPPGPRDVRVRVDFAAPKHGTESHSITGSVQSRKQWNGELRLFLPREDTAPGSAGSPAEERGMGNMVVGTVTAVGAGVTRFVPGDRVFGYGAIREEHQAAENELRSLGSLSESSAVCADPAHVAFVAVRDGNVRIGDQVAVYGLGAIGLLAVQVARASGASQVFAVDPMPIRRDYAKAHGADEAFDPRACDAALEIKRATGNKGVDVALETSGNGAALNDSIRAIRQCGTVVHVPWGPKDASPLHLDEEFHLNRPTIIGSQAVWGNPDRSHPLWNEERARLAAIDLLRRGLITGDGIVTPIVPFSEATDALAAIFSAPERTIKVGVTFPH